MKKNKIGYLITKNKTNLSRMLISSITFLLCLIIIVSPLASALGIFSEGIIPSLKNKLLYIMVVYPIFILYMIYLIKNGRYIIFLRSILYPLIVLNITYGLLLSTIVFNAIIIWLFVYMSSVVFCMIVFACIVGLIYDIKTINSTILPDDYNV